MAVCPVAMPLGFGASLWQTGLSATSNSSKSGADSCQTALYASDVDSRQRALVWLFDAVCREVRLALGNNISPENLLETVRPIVRKPTSQPAYWLAATYEQINK